MNLRYAIFAAGLVNVVAGGIPLVQKITGYEVPTIVLALAYLATLGATYALTQFESWQKVGS